MNQHFVREPSGSTSPRLDQRPDGRHRAHAGDRHRDARRLGRHRLASRAARHEHGLSHLIEHMAFKGTARRSARQIAEDIENVGGDINAATSVEFTSYTARVLGENVGRRPRRARRHPHQLGLRRGELAREKGVILQEYAAVEDTPDDLVYDAFMETAFAGPGRSAARSSARPRPSRRFDEATIRAFLAREYTPEAWCSPPPATCDHARHRRRGRAPFRRHAGRRRAAAPSRAATPAASGASRASSSRPISCSACRACSFKDPGLLRRPTSSPICSAAG